MADESHNNAGMRSRWRARRSGFSGDGQAADRAGDAVGLYLAGRQAYLVRVRSQRGRLPVVSAQLTETLAADSGVAAQQLREHLVNVGGGRMPRRLWTCIQSPGMVLQALRVPQVRTSAMVSAAFWTLKKERNLHTEDTVFDIERLRTVEEEGMQRIELLAVAVPKAEMDEHRQEIAALGAEVCGVSPPVFAFRNFLRLGYPELSRGPCAVLFVNDDSSDVFVFEAGQILAVRTLRTGLDSLRDAIVQKLDIDAADPRAEACLRLLGGEEPAPGLFGGDPIPSAEEVFSWGRPVARRLARNIQRTLHAFEDTLAGAANPVFLIAGSVTRYEPLVTFIGDQIGISLTPFTPRHSEFLRQLCEGRAQTVEESGMSLALGLALADSYETPNLLFTFADRHAQQRRTAVAQALRASMLVLLAVLVFLVAGMHVYVGMRRSQVARLASAVAEASPQFDRGEIDRRLGQAVARQLATRALARAYYAPAVIAEISDLTPEAVRLLEIHVALAPEPTQNAVGKPTDSPKAGKGGKTASLARIRGVIQGEAPRMRPILAEYVLLLQKSPLFAVPSVVEARLETVDENYVVFGDRKSGHLLFFTVETELRGCPDGPAGAGEGGR